MLKRTCGLLLLISFIGIFSASGYGQSILYFPRVISNSNTFTGFAIGNPTPADAAITFTAFSPDGATFAATGIQNPVTVTVPAGGQYSKLFSEIFGARDFNGWIQTTSSSRGLTGFFLNGNGALTDLDGAGAGNPTSEFILPFASDDGMTKTEITLVNVNSETANAHVTLYGANGNAVATKDLSIAARGLVRQTLQGIFGNDLSAASHVRVRSDRALIGHEVVADFAVTESSVRRESIALSGQSMSAAASYIVPQFATGGGWLSLLGIVNGAGVGQEITVTAYKEDGSLWDIPTNPKRLSLDGNAAVHVTVGELFEFPADALATGWIEFHGSVGLLSSFIAYGNTLATSFAAVAGTDASLASRSEVFSQVAEGSGFYTGLTLINPGTEPADVEFYTLRPDGTTVGRATFTLEPKQRIGKLFSELLPASFQQVGGWAFVRSSQPVIGAVLFGSTNGFALANVPQQTPSGDFIPPTQTMGAITGTVSAGGVPIADVQINLSGPVLATTSSDASGRYIFSQLPVGDYKVGALRVGAQFVPAERSISVNRQNIGGVDFEAGGIAAANSPVIQFISPTSIFAANRAFSIRVLGTNFSPSSVIQLNGQELQSSFVSSVELQGVVPAAVLTSPATLKITVATPPPGGGISQAIDFTVNATPADPLVEGRASVGSFPTGVAIDATHNVALVTNQSSDSVTVVDLKTLQQKTTIPVGRSPAEGIAIHKGRNIALVANPGSNNVSVIDLETMRVIKNIAVGRFPVGVAINTNTDRAIVTNAEDGTLSIIDTNSLNVIGQISVGTRPLDIAIQSRTNQAVVTDSVSNAAWIVDLNTNAVQSQVKVGQFPRGVAINSTTNIAVVTNANSNDVSVIDLTTRSVILTAKVDVGPSAVSIHEPTNTALITNSSVPRGSTNYSVASTVSVLDLGAMQITRTILADSAAFGIDIDQDAQRAIVANFGSNDVIAIRVPNPRPRIDDISPQTFPTGGSGVTITATGVGFLPSTVLTLNGQPLPTTYLSYTQLRADISAAMLDRILQVAHIVADDPTPGKNAVTELSFSISASNPGPGGGDALPASDPSRLRILPQNAAPVLISVTPTEATVGTPVTITLSGNNFNGGSVINFGSGRFSPTSSSRTAMTLTLAASDLSAGVVQVSVTNPAPGGGTSSFVSFRINGSSNQTPTINAVTPSSIPAGSGPVTVTVEGTRFATGASANLDSVAGTVSGNIATFTLGVDVTQQPRSLNGMIVNPAPGGGTASFTVNVLNPAPTISGFLPLSADAGSPPLTITITGSNFRSEASQILSSTVGSEAWNSRDLKSRPH